MQKNIFQQIPAPLLSWYNANKRDLPWRINPTPYRVWVSEIMLQQTRVEAVKEYYTRFMEQLPTIEALAACEKAAEKGVRAGIILLEKIKPFGECAENVMRLLPKGVKKIIFLEEEIRAGGMGMLISDEMARRGMLCGIETEIVAVDDKFALRHAGKTMYEDAGVCAEDIIKALMK